MKKCFFAAGILFSILLGSCVNTTPPATGNTPAAAHVGDGFGSVTGKVEAAFAAWPDEKDLFVFAAPFYGKGDEGFFTLDPENHPKSQLEPGGVFMVEKVPAGRYVLVVGPDAESARIVINESGKPLVFEIISIEITDLGIVKIAP
jgi:hypothetical protein